MRVRVLRRTTVTVEEGSEVEVDPGQAESLIRCRLAQEVPPPRPAEKAETPKKIYV